MRKILLSLISLWVFAVSGQQKFMYDATSKCVMYKQSLKLNIKSRPDDVYNLAQTWFNAPSKFTQKNADPPDDTIKIKKNKNKLEVDKQFDNSRPLQILNPGVNKMVGLGLLKYYGGGNSIKLLYLKYDIYIEIEQGLATISVSNIRYFHFMPKSYSLTGIYSFSGGKPCDGEGKIEALIDCENFHDEFKDMAVCFNSNVNNLFTDFKNLLKQKKLLYEASTASSATKPASKKK